MWLSAECGPTTPELPARGGTASHSYIQMDVVCVLSNSEYSESAEADRAIYCTEITGRVKFRVPHFNPDSSIKVYNSNQLCEPLQCYFNYDRQLLLFLIDSEKGVFSSEPNSHVLNQMHLAFGCNDIRFYCSITKESVVVKFWLFGCDDKLVVSDIDGTITRSDITGYLQTVLLKKYDYIHDGVVSFYNDLANLYNLKFVYLTSRPQSHYLTTSQLLDKACNSTSDTSGETGRLPGGPLLMNRESTLRASYREITKDTLVLKKRILSAINEVFRRARSNIGATKTAAGDIQPSCTITANYTPFVYGFGNRENDAKAYNSIGISCENIFLVNTSSKIKVYCKSNIVSQQSSNYDFDSYNDEKLQIYIANNISNTVNHYTNI